MKLSKSFFILLIISFSLILTEFADAKGGRSGGSFGGSRSFGSKPSFQRAPAPSSTPKQSSPSSSFSGSRSANPSPSMQNNRTSSFGGVRSSNHDYTAKYGAPRKQITSQQMSGLPNNYIVNDYGGFSSGLMTGYLMGSTSWLWSMPFHPAFYYSRPVYYNNPDGTVSVYPPTFSFTKLIMGLLIFALAIGLIVWFLRRLRRARNGGYSQSSFS